MHTSIGSLPQAGSGGRGACLYPLCFILYTLYRLALEAEVHALDAGREREEDLAASLRRSEESVTALRQVPNADPPPPAGMRGAV